MKTKIKTENVLMNMLGGTILAFGLYNIHSISSITEGGILGLTVWLYHHFGLSPALTNLIFNIICYLLGLKVLGVSFIIYSAFAGGAFSLSYAIFEMFPRVYPQIASYPILAATLGAIFVGVGIGICVKAGGAPGGDDALAMSISSMTKMKIQWAYLFSDLSVLMLSLTYIPLGKIIYSLYSVILSGQIIGWWQKIRPSRSA
ncbi:MAG: YitT family protein [Eubacteriaceae bacterium]|nr:YitT family protein [Eubacteriaceae bacterium]